MAGWPSVRRDQMAPFLPGKRRLDWVALGVKIWATSWSGEFRRLFEGVPCLETEALKQHADHVLHLAFSRSGDLFASCSKDCTAKVGPAHRERGRGLGMMGIAASL
uniref:Uncharacterized protein n=1 Tax=Anolis carolinensis TaxID=28377 RepID=A0A803T0V8_ANOCA